MDEIEGTRRKPVAPRIELPICRLPGRARSRNRSIRPGPGSCPGWPRAQFAVANETSTGPASSPTSGIEPGSSCAVGLRERVEHPAVLAGGLQL